MSERGRYIVIEGNDGNGKSKQQEILVGRLLLEGVHAETVPEPGGTEFGAELRKVIKNGVLEKDGITNLLLFTADRRELWQQRIEPMLENGSWVVADRNWYSTLAYQGYGEGVDRQVIEELTLRFAGPGYANPDLSFVLGIDDESERLRRTSASADTVKDAFESRGSDFQNSVNEGYRQLTSNVGAVAIRYAKDDSPQAVHEMLWPYVEQLLT